MARRVYREVAAGGYTVTGGKPDCVVGFSFGFRKEGDKILPGLANQALAQWLTKYGNIPKILQFEIADAYEALDPDIRNDWIMRVEEHRVKGAYLDTREAAEQARLYMQMHGFANPLVIAHPAHVPRCRATLNKLGFEAITGIISLDETALWDPESVQWQTHSFREWKRYELAACILYGYKGWI